MEGKEGMENLVFPSDTGYSMNRDRLKVQVNKIIEKLSILKILQNKLNNEFGIQINIEHIKLKLDDLVRYNNLRDIKRKLEDTVFGEFFKCFNNK